MSYAYDERDRLLTENTTGYTWDENGNMTGKQGEADYTWDYEDRLITVTLADATTVNHTYDADGVRVQSLTDDGTDLVEKNYLVDTAGALSHVVAETDASGNLVAYYVRGGDQLLAVISGAETRYYHAEGIGSVRALTDEDGNVTDEYGYTAFGEAVGWDGGSGQPYRFVGEEWEGIIELYFLRNRSLAAITGRFISADPLTALGWKHDQSNAYLYTSDNPVNRTDPTGLLWIGMVSSQIQNNFHADLRVQARFNLLDDKIEKAVKFNGKYAVSLAAPAVEVALKRMFENSWFKRFFGSITTHRLMYVSRGLTNIHRRLGKEFDFRYLRTESPTLGGATYSNNPNSPIWLTKNFLKLPFTGLRSKVHTLVHEVSHMVHGTDDIRRGYWASISLAGENSGSNASIFNADNYAFFVTDLSFP